MEILLVLRVFGYHLSIFLLKDIFVYFFVEFFGRDRFNLLDVNILITLNIILLCRLKIHLYYAMY